MTLLADIKWLLIVLFVLVGNGAADAAQIPLRGVVEGFYGKPWTQEERLSQFRFYGEQGLNAYIYAPKDDVWHRAKWREPYPAEKMQQLQELAETARECGVEFIFAVSPGGDLHFSGKQGEADRRSMLRKLETVYQLGVRRFAIFFDDIENRDGKGQAAFLNWLNAHVVHSYEGVRPLITVPTEYFLADMLEQGVVKSYTADFAAALDADILVLYTGDGVVPEGISSRDMQKVSAVYRRSMGVWWNYPVSDYLKEKLALGPIHGLNGEAPMAAFFMNPMEHAELSKITLATGADFAQEPLAYDEEASWEQALCRQYGSQAENMRLFAEHSQRMENSWAHTGRQDAPAMKSRMEQLWRKLAAKEVAATEVAATEITCLNNDFTRLEQACQELLQALPREKLAECAPQLQLLATIAGADRIALAMIEAEGDGKPQLAGVYYRLLIKERVGLSEKEKKATISEKTAREFLNQAILWYENGQERAGREKGVCK